MNQDLKSLYKDILLKHSREPLNKGPMIDADASKQIKNPLCGDIATLYLSFDGERIRRTSFEAQCCSICMASASLLTAKVVNTTKNEGRDLATSLIDLLSGKAETALIPQEDDLNALCGVKEFPSRLRCATLPWEALLSLLALDEDQEG